MSVIANYCGTVILLRQLVKEGYCTNKEATRIAALIARQTGVDIKLPEDLQRRCDRRQSSKEQWTAPAGVGAEQSPGDHNP